MKRALEINMGVKRKTLIVNKRKEQLWNIIAQRIGCVYLLSGGNFSGPDAFYQEYERLEDDVKKRKVFYE